MTAEAFLPGGFASRAQGILAVIIRSIIALARVTAGWLATLVLLAAFSKLLMLLGTIGLFFVLVGIV